MMPKQQQKQKQTALAARLAKTAATSGTIEPDANTNNTTTGTIAATASAAAAANATVALDGSQSRVAIERNEHKVSHYSEESHDYAETGSLPLKQHRQQLSDDNDDDETTINNNSKTTPEAAGTGERVDHEDAQRVDFAPPTPPNQRQQVRQVLVGGSAGNEQSESGGRLETEHKHGHSNIGEESSYYCCTSGENSRCNCSGRRRATLASLIELFEQKLKVENLDKTDLASRHQRAANHRKTAKIEAAKAINEKISIKQQQNKVNKQTHNMRNIITPVKYELSEEEPQDDDDDDDEEDENEAADEDQPAEAEQDSLEEEEDNDDYKLGATRNRNRLHHIAAKGVSVLPKPNLQRLTKTNWQPPTDGRKYELVSSANPSRRSCNKCSNCRSIGTNQRATSHQPEGVKTQSTNGNRTLPRSVASRGPSIVKHQSSSSRRQLSQLARLRRLKEPTYKVKRPEKVAEVEALIEQLERATAEWEEDDLLMDRADRRDWPLQYYERFKKPSPATPNAERVNHRLSTGVPRELSVSEIDFGHRGDVNSLEEQTISESHSVCNLDPMDPVRFNSAGSWSASSTLNRRPRSRAFADRYFDDLAVRRLSRSPSTITRNSTTPESTSSSRRQPQMSYLLCSNAYTPTIEDANPYSPWDSSLERQVRSDDLHYRGVKPKPEPHEPPFGIPRQNAVASSHSSATHYLRRQQVDRPTQTTPTPAYVYTYSQNKQAKTSEDLRQHKRVESKVSFVGNLRSSGGCASADSGVAAESPVLNSGRHSEASRRTPSSLSRTATPLVNQSPSNQAVDFGYEDDVAQEIDLDEELRLELERCSSACDSPAIERYKAEIKNTPQRSRPKISIENPRSKSPLLRVASEPKSISELECQIDFSDDEDKKDGPVFSIGEYKPMNKPNLKIL